MKKIILVLSVMMASAAQAGPAEAVSDTIGKMLNILASGSEATKVSGLCRLARQQIEVVQIGADLLGYQYYNSPTDQNGVRQFVNLVPSIIVSEFYGRLSGLGTAYTVNPNLLPKGSSRVGVQVTVGNTRLIVTANKTTGKVLDVEYMGISLVLHKKAEFEPALRASATKGGLPVTELVSSLINSGNLVRCN